LIGGLHALPDESFSYKCSKNTTSSRAALLEAFEYFNLTETFEGVQSIHESIKYFDEMGMFCYWSFKNELTKEHFLRLFTIWWEIPVNLLYNVGNMWVDGVNYCFYTPKTVPQGDWGFFTVYLIGDFIMRFFYRDETPS
jgi:hypothetical protein